jgi:N-methylhydantoinase A
VLCAYGDATTRLRDEASRTMIRRFETLTDAHVLGVLEELAAEARKTLEAEGLGEADMTTSLLIDVRYHGQGLGIPIPTTLETFRASGLKGLGKSFDDTHTQLFTFALDAPHELVTMRAVVQGPEPLVRAESLEKGGKDPSAALVETTSVYVDGADHEAGVYDRTKLQAGNIITGPAIVAQMDATTLILPGHAGEVDPTGCILIRPTH